MTLTMVRQGVSLYRWTARNMPGLPLNPQPISLRLWQPLTAPGHGVLHLMQVVPPVTNALKPLHLRSAVKAGRAMQEHVEELQQYLDETANALRKGTFGHDIADLNLDVTSSVVVDDDEAHAIIRTAEHGEEDKGRGAHSDAIAMATHGRSGLQRWATSSNTGRVLEATRLC